MSQDFCNRCLDSGWYENNAATHICDCPAGERERQAIAGVKAKQPKKLFVKIEIDPKGLEYLGSSCNSAYWAEIKRNDKGETFVREHNLEERGVAPGPWVLLTDRKRLQGLQLLAKLNPFQFGRYLDGNADRETGDCWLQATVLGEIKYG